jgi:hypothetical protein
MMLYWNDRIQTERANATKKYDDLMKSENDRIQLERAKMETDATKKYVDLMKSKELYWDDRIQLERATMNNKYIVEMNQLQDQLRYLNSKATDVEATIEIRSKDIERSVSNKYIVEINQLKDRLKDIEQSVSNKYIVEINQLKDRLNDAKNATDVIALMNDKFETIDKYFNKHSNNVRTGDIGEDFVYQYLKQYLELGSGSLDIVKGKGHLGDLSLVYENLKCIIEVKNHSESVRQDNIARFSTIDLLNVSYNSGLFISIKSDIVANANIKHFDIKYYNNKPAVFITHAIQRPHDIVLGIKILNFLVYQESFTNESVSGYVALLQNQLEMLSQVVFKTL